MQSARAPIPALPVRRTSEHRPSPRVSLLILAFAPVVPHLLGSIFNICYNSLVVQPMLGHGLLRERFYLTIIAYNCLAFPLAVGLWLGRITSFRAVLRKLETGEAIDPEKLLQARQRAIHLPLFSAVVSSAAWLLTIPAFLISLAPAEAPAALLWHLPIAFTISGFIAITNSYFLTELVTQWLLFPALFRDARADLTPGVITLSLRGRGLLWAVSVSVCPIVSLLLLEFAPASPVDPRWFSTFVGVVGMGFALTTSLLMSRLVVRPVDQLRAAAQAIGRGEFEVELPVRRADEFGYLIGEFNQMARGLKEKKRLRETFGLHVGERAAEQILAQDPGLGGVEQEVTVMFVDLRGFTAFAENRSPRETLEVLNEFLRVTVRIVEEEHGGMINKFLGDGFMALFGVGAQVPDRHARKAFAAARGILRGLVRLNEDFAARGREPLALGIALHTGPAIIGSIGSPARLEFTAIGATVNLAARLEKLTKQLHTPLLLSAATRMSLGDQPELVECAPVDVRGLDEPVIVFALQSAPNAAR